MRKPKQLNLTLHVEGVQRKPMTKADVKFLAYVLGSSLVILLIVCLMRWL